MTKVLLHLSDWNYQDKYYELSYDQLKELSKLITTVGIDKAWDWFVPQVDYGGNPERPIKRVDDEADHTLDEYFLDWEHPKDCVEEWGLDA